MCFRAQARSRRHSRNLTKICCSDRISDLNTWRIGRPLDPAWTLVSTLVIHVLSRAGAIASPFQKPDQNMLLGQDFRSEHVANRAALGPCLDPGFHLGDPCAFARRRDRVAIPET